MSYMQMEAPRDSQARQVPRNEIPFHRCIDPYIVSAEKERAVPTIARTRIQDSVI